MRSCLLWSCEMAYRQICCLCIEDVLESGVLRRSLGTFAGSLLSWLAFKAIWGTMSSFLENFLVLLFGSLLALRQSIYIAIITHAPLEKIIVIIVRQKGWMEGWLEGVLNLCMYVRFEVPCILYALLCGCAYAIRRENKSLYICNYVSVNVDALYRLLLMFVYSYSTSKYISNIVLFYIVLYRITYRTL